MGFRQDERVRDEVAARVTHVELGVKRVGVDSGQNPSRRHKVIELAQEFYFRRRAISTDDVKPRIESGTRRSNVDEIRNPPVAARIVSKCYPILIIGSLTLFVGNQPVEHER